LWTHHVVLEDCLLPQLVLLPTLSDIKKGDKILSVDEHGINITTVRCVVKTTCHDGSTPKLLELNGGLLITPWHPIRQNGKWIFPCQTIDHAYGKATDSAVYTFLLDSKHIAIINDIECLCLGHGIEGDEVASHWYYGTKRVVEDLKKQTGWEEGRVEVVNNPLVLHDVSTN